MTSGIENKRVQKRVQFLSTDVHICPYYKEKGLPKNDSPLTVFIELILVAGEGFEPPTFGL